MDTSARAVTVLVEALEREDILLLRHEAAKALGRLGATLPIVVRLDGTNEEEGRRIIAERAPANVVVEETMLSAARRAVELAGAAA